MKNSFCRLIDSIGLNSRRKFTIFNLDRHNYMGLFAVILGN